MVGRQGNGATASKETTVRHALVTVHLIDQATTAANAEAEARQRRQAPVDGRVGPDPEPRRLAALARRARALVVRTT
jgi:hypothetical protein